MKKLLRQYNLYFIIPFAIWLVAGGILMLLFSDQTLFMAINTNHSNELDALMYTITYMGRVEVILPVLLAIFFIRRYYNRWYFITAALCNVLPLLLQKALKLIISRPRPLSSFYHSGWLHFETWWDQLFSDSFPSGHSEGAFSFFCFLALLLPARYKYFGLVFFVLAIEVCYSRIYLAAHFFTDVYTGSIVGCIPTLLIYSLMNQFRSKLGMKKEQQIK